jgi:hypothetical protein
MDLDVLNTTGPREQPATEVGSYLEVSDAA